MYINGGKYQELKAIFDGLAARQTKHSLMICGICRLAPMDILPINTASIGSSKGRRRTHKNREVLSAVSLGQFRCELDIGLHSYLKASSGSTLSARRTGSQQASSATPTNSAPTRASVTGSLSWTSNKNDRSTRDKTIASATPATTPPPIN